MLELEEVCQIKNWPHSGTWGTWGTWSVFQCKLNKALSVHFIT